MALGMTNSASLSDDFADFVVQSRRVCASECNFLFSKSNLPSPLFTDEMDENGSIQNTNSSQIQPFTMRGECEK